MQVKIPHVKMSCNFLFLFFCVCSVTTLARSMNFQSEIEESEDIRKYLKKINKPAVKTIESPDGDLIDCVLIHQQPALDHPLLRRHKPITDLPALPKGYYNNNQTFEEEDFQVWRMSGESCPENTIPIRRRTEEDVLRTRSLQRKRITNASNDAFANHEHALAFTAGDKCYGAEAYINLWHPKVENPGEFSLAQIWVLAGSIDAGTLNSVEVGSIVTHGDNYARLFIFWTSDSYRNTGCYNLHCRGFVQVTRNALLGGTFKPVSTYNGQQYSVRVTVWKDPDDGNWWLAVQGKQVGYWPSSLFPLLGANAGEVQFGGEVVNSGIGGHHTSTQMGSGHFPNEGFRKSAYIRNIQLVNSNNKRVSGPKLQTLTEKPKCYSAQVGVNQNWGTHMYYGGAGRDSNGCT